MGCLTYHEAIKMTPYKVVFGLWSKCKNEIGNKSTLRIIGEHNDWNAGRGYVGNAFRYRGQKILVTKMSRTRSVRDSVFKS